jgi:uncharacterized protein with NAD-binding domain and iron-sulfur cluster
MKRVVGKKVIILGAGVAGMSAAHELIERGFEVEVYELRSVAGGKARSIDVPGSVGRHGKALPGEHGFRFFPGFYKHVTHTMKRTPASGAWRTGLKRALGKGPSVYDNLRAVPRVYFDRGGDLPIALPAHFPKLRSDLGIVLHEFWKAHRGLIGIDIEDINFFALRLWQVVTSCERRRGGEYERVSWWDFMEADTRGADSPQYKEYLVQTMTRSLVAAKADKANAKVVGDIAVQILSGLLQPGPGADWILNRPTSEIWIEPWRAFLHQQGVRFTFNRRTAAFNYDGRQLTSVTLVPVDDQGRACGQPEKIGGPDDYYIAALPVEVMARLLSGKNNRPLRDADSQLANILDLGKRTAWMNGIQFYFKEKLDLGEGHVVYLDSPWALTAVSQPQFWKDHLKLNTLGDGSVQDIVSLIISDWEKPGKWIEQPAKACCPDDIYEEVLMQMAHHMLDLPIKHPEVAKKKEELKALFAHPPFLDPELKRQHPAKGARYRNDSPLFINEPNTWRMQPDAKTRVPNLFLASDYVRTFTQLATMEAANEAARRAVNSIISAMIKEQQNPASQKQGWDAGTANVKAADLKPSKLWDLHEPWIFWPWRWHDERRYRRGLPWNATVPWWVPIVREAVLVGYEIYLWLAGKYYATRGAATEAEGRMRTPLPNAARENDNRGRFPPAATLDHSGARNGTAHEYTNGVELESELIERHHQA